jgi:hypothetical protein
MNLGCDRRCEPGRDRELRAFMRFVDNVRRNCCVKSVAQVSGNGSSDGRFGTGFLRGTPLFSDMINFSHSQFDVGGELR